MSTVLRIPERCIWCCEATPAGDPEKADESHVLLASLGNADHVLPPGVVCRPCNNYFGTQVDPALIEFPPIITAAALLEVMHTRRNKLFRDSVPGVGPIPETPSEIIEVAIGVESSRFVLDLRRPIVGRYEKAYRPKNLRVLSRAVYKLLIESIALQVYVLGHPEPVDLFGTDFDHGRRWVRRGKPFGPARPWLWQFPTQDLLQSWRIEPLYRVRGRGLVRLRVFGSWFFAEVTSANGDALSSLLESQPASNIFRFSDSIEPTEHVPGE